VKFLWLFFYEVELEQGQQKFDSDFGFERDCKEGDSFVYYQLASSAGNLQKI